MNLRIDFTVQCDRCDETATATMDVTNTATARTDFEKDGWKRVGDENVCPVCAEDA